MHPTAPTSGPGRPRDPRLDVAITEAALAVIREYGWSRFTMEEVALRAGVSKASVYRRYPSKIALVFDAWVGDRDIRFPTTDTGTSWGDLTAYVLGTLRMGGDSAWSAILPALLAEAPTDPAVAKALGAVWTWRTGVLQAILDRGVTRREIRPGTEVQHVREMIDGPILLRIMVSGDPLDSAFADRLVEDTMAVIGRPR